MSDIPDLNSILLPSEFDKRAIQFANYTLYDLSLKYGEKGLIIDLQTSEYQQYITGRHNECLRHLADEEGNLRLGDIPFASTGYEVDDAITWNFNQIDSEQLSEEIFSADNTSVSSSFRMEIPGTLNIHDYNWDAINEAFSEIAQRAINLQARLIDKMSSTVYCREDGTVCVQIFTEFLFNETQEPQPLGVMESKFQKIIKITREGFEGSFVMFELNSNES